MQSPQSSDPISPTLGLSSNVDTYTVRLLQRLLGIEYVLYAKTQHAHWNVVGMSFGALHELLGDQYEKIAKFIDRIAEQIRKLGAAAPGSLNLFLKLNHDVIPESNYTLINQVDAVRSLLLANEAVVRFVQLNYDPNLIDIATQNMLAEIVDKHMKNAWMLRAHLE